MAFNDRLREARLKGGMTQEQLAIQIGVAKSTLTGYEKGYREPDMNKISKIIAALDVSANFLFQDEMKQIDDNAITVKERELIEKYRTLDTFGKHTIETLLQSEHTRCKIQESTTQNGSIGSADKVILPYLGDYSNKGLASFLSENEIVSIESIKVDKNLKNSNFVIEISDNSLEPVYFKGDLLCIEKSSDLLLGEIGLFVINNTCYLKQLGKNCLISINKEYETIDLDYDDKYLTIGKVTGKVV